MRERPVIAVANRLPVHQGDGGGWELSPGGLVTALRPVMSTHRGAWVGWDGGTRGMPQALPDSSIQLVPIGLSAAPVPGYYPRFPNPARLPWREHILTGLLGADVIAFHTDEYRGNFLRACSRLLGGSGIEVSGSSVVLPDGRAVATSTAPISIDAAEYARLASDLDVDE